MVFNYKKILYLFIVLINISAHSEELYLKIDTIDVSIQTSIIFGNTKTVRFICFWEMCNATEEEITNVSTPWSNKYQDNKFGCKQPREKRGGNSNLLIVHDSDTLFPLRVKAYFESMPKIYNYKRLSIPSGKCKRGRGYGRYFDYTKLKKIINQSSSCYLIMKYDSRYERVKDVEAMNIRERNGLVQRLKSANHIADEEYRFRKDIYEGLNPIKRVKIDSEPYKLTRQWWDKIDKSVLYYSAINTIISPNGKNKEISALLLSMLGNRDDIPYIKSIMDEEGEFGNNKYYVVESLARLGSICAIPYLIEYLLANNSDSLRMTGGKYLKDYYRNIEDINRNKEHIEVSEDMLSSIDTLKSIVSANKTFSTDTISLSKMGIYYLEELTGKTFGYDPDAPKKERDAAIKRWEKWWEDNKDRCLKEDTDNTESSVDIFKERMKYYEYRSGL